MTGANIFLLLRKSLHSSACEIIWDDFGPTFLKSIEKNRILETHRCLIQNKTNIKRSSSGSCEKKYILSMFPYPSGNLHMGHVRVYATADAMARFYFMKGYEVIHPMGWDAFGLPTENAAMERGENPTKWTNFNTSNMKSQLDNLACCFDWSHELATCDPKYYKWTQLLFLKMFKTGLAYKQEAIVNWDPVDKTVLANEQVSTKGISWRSGAKVEKKLLSQWFIRTTRYSKDLYNDLKTLPIKSWDMVAAIQRHWIGECNGYSVEMKLSDSNHNSILNYDMLPIWTSNLESLQNISFLSIPSGHYLNQNKFYASKHNNITVLNIFAKEPLTQSLLPIIVCDDFDYSQGSQVYCGTPSINEKDRNICVTCKFTVNFLKVDDIHTQADCLLSNKDNIVNKILKSGGQVYMSSSKLKDWLISRQRYWGTPIPIIYCEKCGTVPVPEENLPVELPEVKGFMVKGAAILKEEKEWYHCRCPRCSGAAVRETDTMDTFVDSSWYFLRYLDINNTEEMVSKAKADCYMPVDLYIGGKEHAELHLFYARFVYKFLKDQGLVSHSEPFHKLLTLAVVKSKSYQVVETGKYLKMEEVDFSVSPPVEKITGAALKVVFEKMSKSKHNGVDPQSILDEYGVDATRLNILTNNDPRLDIKWTNEDMPESLNFFEKLYFYVKSLVLSRVEGLPRTTKISGEETLVRERFLSSLRDNYILQVTHHYENCQFLHVRQNLQKMLNEVTSSGQIMLLSDEYERCLRSLIIMLTPICPTFCSEMWERLNSLESLPEIDKTASVFDQSWPCVSPNFPINMECQVNFISIGNLQIPFSVFSSLDANSATALAKCHPELNSSLGRISILEMLFNSSEIQPCVNFLTMPRKEIVREIDVEIQKKLICSIKISQNDYEVMSEKKVAELVRNNTEFRTAVEGFSVRGSKFNFVPNGRSKISYFVKPKTPIK